LQDLLGKVVEQVTQSKDGMIQKLLTQVLSRINLSALAAKFKEAGLDKIFASWVGKGPNQPITPEQVKSLLGNEQVQALANEYNISTEEVEKLVATHLPQLVDELTPDGELPPDQ
jgi:uncharacterized protein YidB (DUF937 family)